MSPTWCRFWYWIACHLLPRELVYFAVVRAFSHASTGRWEHDNAMQITAVDLLDRWIKGKA